MTSDIPAADVSSVPLIRHIMAEWDGKMPLTASAAGSARQSSNEWPGRKGPPAAR